MGEPQRTCVGCRRTAPKSSLVRIGVGPGGVAVDPRAIRPGRGAYLHRDPDCARAAIRHGSLARALRTGIGADEVSNLLRDLEGAIEQP